MKHNSSLLFHRVNTTGKTLHLSLKNNFSSLKLGSYRHSIRHLSPPFIIKLYSPGKVLSMDQPGLHLEVVRLALGSYLGQV